MGKTKPPSPMTINRINKLVPVLKTRELTSKEMIEILQIDHLENKRKIIWNILMTIGDTWPLYEPIPAHFKILTDDDIKEYRELYLRQRSPKHYVK